MHQGSLALEVKAGAGTLASATGSRQVQGPSGVSYLSYWLHMKCSRQQVPCAIDTLLWHLMSRQQPS